MDKPISPTVLPYLIKEFVAEIVFAFSLKTKVKIYMVKYMASVPTLQLQIFIIILFTFS